MSDQPPQQFRPPDWGQGGPPSFTKGGVDVQAALGRPQQEPAPGAPRPRGPRWPFVVVGLVVLLLFVLVAAVVVNAIRDHQASSDTQAGGEEPVSVAVSGNARGTRSGRGSLEIDYPERHTQWQPFVLHLTGEIDTPQSSLGGGAIVATLLVRGDCPATSDAAGQAAQDRGGVDISSLNAFDNGPFQMGARRSVYVDPGQYNVCAYIAGSRSSSRDELVTHGPLTVVGGNPDGSPYDATFIEPGRYVAKGSHVSGAGANAELQFVVEETSGTGGRLLQSFTGKGLSRKTCDSGDRSSSTLRSEQSNDVVYDTFTEMYFDAGFSVTAGYWSDDEVRGQVYQRYGTCTRVIPFEAKRAN